jgi:Tfp pilus assembly protein PilX
MKNRFRQKASALVTTLFVVVVLTTIVMAFMASMSLERQIAKSMKNKYQADLAADAGMQDFLSRLQNIKSDGPYSAFYLLGANTNPYLFLGKRAFTANGTITKRVPLFSTVLTNFQDLTNFTASFLSSAAISIQDIDRSGNKVSRSLSSSNDIWCDINKTNAQFPSGIVGLRNTFTNTNNIPTLSANWVYIKNAAGKVVGRYAYWADDECSKLDIRYAGQSANTLANHTRSNGALFSDLALTPLTNTPNAAVNLAATNLANLLAFTNSSIQALPLSVQNVQYSIANSGNLSTAQWQSLKPFITLYSRHDDRSLDGKRRVNLNALITSTTNATDVAQQTLTIRDAITNNLPDFGKRFYSASNGTLTMPTTAHQKAYATRIAANIRDYIDSDSQATIIQSDDTAYSGNSANFIAFDPTSLQDSDLPLALGKESGLCLSEYARVARVVNQPNGAHPASSTTPVTIQVRFGHYVELCNVSGKTITTADLGSDPHIVLAGRGSWVNAFPAASGGSPDKLRLSDVKMSLPSGLSIPPGGHVYLTTDGGTFPCDSQNDLLGSTTTNRYQLTFGTSAGKWNLVNTSGNTPASTDSGFEDYFITTRATNSGSGNSTSYRYAVYNSESNPSPSYPNQQERLILANSSGIIDCAFRIYNTIRQYLYRNAQNPSWCATCLGDAESKTDNNTPNELVSDPRFTRGDLRSNFEIVSVIKKSTSQSWKDSAEGLTGSSLASSTWMTLGNLNYNYGDTTTYTGDNLWRKGWYEYTTDPAGNAFYKNTNLTSLAELGYIYDPVRHDIEGYRSMGATLRIGQSDSPTNNRATNSAANYQNWLGGRGSDSATNTAYAKNAFLLMDVFRTDTNTSGRINPNSVVRDGVGVVLQSALTNFVYETNATNGASSLLGNQTLNATNAISAIRDFTTNSTNGFIVSVGDLSRIPAFWGNGNSSTNIVPGKVMSAASDTGKEEFLRRTANLLTTQSLAYSVYIVGQTGEIQTKSGADAFVPISTTITENVIQLEPVYPSTPNEQPVVPIEWKTLKPKSISY